MSKEHRAFELMKEAIRKSGLSTTEFLKRWRAGEIDA